MILDFDEGSAIWWLHLRKGLQPCPVCWKTIRVGNVRHRLDLECHSRVVFQRYKECGWSHIDATQAKILEEAGVDVEWADGGYHQEVVYNEHHVAIGLWDAKHDIAFTPTPAARAIRALTRIQMPKALRRKAARALYEKQEYLDVLDSLKRMGGKPRLKELREIVEEACNSAPGA